MRLLFIGDIIGKAGRKILSEYLDNLLDKYKIDLCIANGENAAGGFGITHKIGQSLFNMGINVISSGNHIWDKKEALEYLPKENNLLRPANYPKGVPGSGSTLFRFSDGSYAGVLNLSGRVFMPNLDCPFQTADREIPELKKKAKFIIVDMHAEATSEKIAMGWYLDGKVSAIIGTHTHVQTADEKILPKGTAYITDAGMTGPVDSVIGMKKEIAIFRFKTSIPEKFSVASGDIQLNAVLVEMDSKSGLAKEIKRIQLTSS
ncbi:MAG: TIGR00282 family metallophosphoesterase [Nitrospinota bacterium]|nr:TIGR00282 family metallophosphoesterase [Nitrospinota bacterium]